MPRLLTSKPVLIAGALAARKKIVAARARRRRRKIAGITASLVALTAAGAAAYRLWTRRTQSQPDDGSAMHTRTTDRKASAINLDVPAPTPNI